MLALNIKVEDTSGQTELIHNPYKDSLDDVLDGDINDTAASTIDTNPWLLRQITSAIQPRTPFNIPLPLGLFSEVANGGGKNSSPSAKRSLSPTLPPSILLKEPSNLLLRLTSNYGKLSKRKPRAVLTSQGLEDLGYIMESGSQGTSAVSKSNTNSTKSS